MCRMDLRVRHQSLLGYWSIPYVHIHSSMVNWEVRSNIICCIIRSEERHIYYSNLSHICRMDLRVWHQPLLGYWSIIPYVHIHSSMVDRKLHSNIIYMFSMDLRAHHETLLGYWSIPYVHVHSFMVGREIHSNIIWYEIYSEQRLDQLITCWWWFKDIKQFVYQRCPDERLYHQ